VSAPTAPSTLPLRHARHLLRKILDTWRRCEHLRSCRSNSLRSHGSGARLLFRQCRCRWSSRGCPLWIGAGGQACRRRRLPRSRSSTAMNVGYWSDLDMPMSTRAPGPGRRPCGCSPHAGRPRSPPRRALGQSAGAAPAATGWTEPLGSCTPPALGRRQAAEEGRGICPRLGTRTGFGRCRRRLIGGPQAEVSQFLLARVAPLTKSLFGAHEVIVRAELASHTTSDRCRSWASARDSRRPSDSPLSSTSTPMLLGEHSSRPRVIRPS
jgi:hypothetical protein